MLKSELIGWCNRGQTRRVDPRNGVMKTRSGLSLRLRRAETRSVPWLASMDYHRSSCLAGAVNCEIPELNILRLWRWSLQARRRGLLCRWRWPRGMDRAVSLASIGPGTHAASTRRRNAKHSKRSAAFGRVATLCRGPIGLASVTAGGLVIVRMMLTWLS